MFTGFTPPTNADRPYTVSEINAGVAATIESGNTLVWVEAEISNFKRATSGHCYFTLKDDQSQVSAVLWRGNALQIKFQPESGMAVLVIASIRVYQKGGTYQLDVHKMQPSGQGALHAAFEKLKERLGKEGLFDETRKRPIPDTVARLGVITSKRGAAVRDILRVVSTRSPQTDVLIMDVAVQGEAAAPQIAQAIRDMNTYGNVDCIIVGRGGGSLEDLWAFNEEAVARAIFESGTPVISAVGHEVDFTIADFVADVRAPTPSAAAEMAVPDTKENLRYFQNVASRFSAGFLRYYNDVRSRYKRCTRSPALRKPLRLFAESRQAHDDLRERSVRAVQQLLERHRLRLARAAGQLSALSPLEVLARGYAVVSTTQGESVRSSAQVNEGDEVGLRFHSGSAKAMITAKTSAP